LKPTTRLRLTENVEEVVDGNHEDIRSLVSNAVRAGDPIVTLPGIDGPIHIFVAHILTIRDDPFQKLMARRS